MLHAGITFMFSTGGSAMASCIGSKRCHLDEAYQAFYFVHTIKSFTNNLWNACMVTPVA